MLAVNGQPNAHLEAAPAARGTLPVRVGRHRRPRAHVPVHAGRDRADDQRQALTLRRQPGVGPGRGALLPARGRRCTTTASSTSPRPRAAARRRPDPTRSRATATVPGRSGPTTPGPAAAAGVPVARARRRSTSPTTSPRASAAPWCVCEDNVNDNYLRGLPEGGQLSDIALNRLTSATGAPRFNDEFAGSTFSPDGRDALREHPGARRDDVRDLGPLAPDRCLTSSSGSDRPGGRWRWKELTS